jgi:exopolyphosphatase/guanosine-5'-triphosphate,3'-diphosphate pyrophosphatase
MLRYGMVDIGSNTVRIVIYALTKGIDYHVLINEKEAIRLRNYVDNNILKEEGIEELVRVLSRYKKIANRFRMEEFVLFATQTIRMVDNRNEVLQRVKKETGFNVRILSKEEECTVGFTGMSSYLPHQKEGVYVDLGGGSTEVVYFKNDEPVYFHSFDFGSVVLRNQIDTPVPEEIDLKAYESFLLEQFDSIPWLKDLKVPLVVVGGSSRNMVRIDRFITRREESTHGYTIHFRELERTRKLLMLLTIDEIEKIEGFTSSRADIIIPSIYVFELLYKYINAPYYVCSRTGLREGMLIELLRG